MTKPKGVISIKKANALNNEWTKTRKQAMDKCIQDETGGKIKEDNRSSWWSLDDLTAYIKYAKKQAKKKGFELNGFRVYAGAYNKNNNCYCTSFIVPTAEESLGKDGNGITESIDLAIKPLNRGQGGHPPNASYPNQ